MRSFPPTELLQHWEAGHARPHWEWAAALVAAAFPELGAEGCGALTVGERDGRLLELREALFGPELACRSTCPACGEPVEMEVNVAALRASCGDGARHDGVRLRVAAGEIRVRPATSRDLVAAASTGPDVARIRERLLQHCVVTVGPDGDMGTMPELLPDETKLVIDAMATADPQADLRLALGCPACGHRWSEVFDIVTFLWTEMEDWAARQLREVHALASAYGWTESEVLALSPLRRARYLELVSA